MTGARISGGQGRAAATMIRGYPALDRDSKCSTEEPKGVDVVKLIVRDRESIQEAVRRFRKLVDRSGIKKEMRRREYYEKPSAIKRRARLRAERRSRRMRLLGGA